MAVDRRTRDVASSDIAIGSSEQPHTYPHGVPCWIELESPDPDGSRRFYGGLLRWTFADPTPPDAPPYWIASLDGHDAAAIAPAAGEVTWWTYMAVDDADDAATVVADTGGQVVTPPIDVGPPGRMAECVDPTGAAFRLWQPGRRLGSQVNNAPGSWNFSDLHTDDRAAALACYTPVFGWEVKDMGPDAGAMLRVPGYGDHLEATVDPDIRERQAGAPEGFADAIGGVVGLGAGEVAHWHVTFSVADRDAAMATAERLGAEVLDTADATWALTATVRDPHGAVLTLSQFRPPSETPT